MLSVCLVLMYLWLYIQETRPIISWKPISVHFGRTGERTEKRGEGSLGLSRASSNRFCRPLYTGAQTGHISYLVWYNSVTGAVQCIPWGRSGSPGTRLRTGRSPRRHHHPPQPSTPAPAWPPTPSSTRQKKKRQNQVKTKKKKVENIILTRAGPIVRSKLNLPAFFPAHFREFRTEKHVWRFSSQ